MAPGRVGTFTFRAVPPCLAAGQSWAHRKIDSRFRPFAIQFTGGHFNYYRFIGVFQRRLRGSANPALSALRASANPALSALRASAQDQALLRRSAKAKKRRKKRPSAAVGCVVTAGVACGRYRHRGRNRYRNRYRIRALDRGTVPPPEARQSTHPLALGRGWGSRAEQSLDGPPRARIGPFRPGSPVSDSAILFIVSHRPTRTNLTGLGSTRTGRPSNCETKILRFWPRAGPSRDCYDFRSGPPIGAPDRIM